MSTTINGTDNSAAAPALVGSDTDTGVFFPAANTTAFSNGGTETMRIDSSGNVNIGTTAAYGGRLNIVPASTPTTALGANQVQVGESSANTGYRLQLGYFNDPTNGFVGSIQSIGGGAANNLVLQGYGGNVGIGTTSPSGVLDVRKNQNATSNFYFQNTDTTSAASRAYLNLNSGTNYLIWKSIHADHNYIDRATGTNLYFQCNNSIQAVLDSGGVFLVGKTSTNFGASGAQFYPGNGGSSITSDNIDTLGLNRLTSNGTIIGFYRSSTAVGSISVTTTATAYNTSSDYRLKENIAPMQNALSVVQQLKPVTYTWKSTGKDSQGFIAHELQAVVPDCVTGEKDAVDEEGKPVYQGIDTSFLVATLTAAIQELKAELDATKAEVQALKAK